MLFRNTSIRLQLRSLAVLTGALVIIILLAFYLRMINLIVERNDKYINDVFVQVTENLNLVSSGYSRLLTVIANNPAVQDYMRNQDPVAQFESSQILRRFLSQMVAFSDGIIDVLIRPDVGPDQSLAIAGIYFDLKTVHDPNSRSVQFSPLSDYGSPGNERRRRVIVVSVTTLMTLNQAGYGSQLGTVALVVDARAFVRSISAGSDNLMTRFYLFGSGGNLLNEDNGLNGPIPSYAAITNLDAESLTLDGKPYLVQTALVSPLMGLLVALTPRAELLADVFEIGNLLLAVTITAIAAVLLSFGLLARNVSQPIIQLTALISRLRAQDPISFGERASPDGFLEISMMAREFNEMLDEIGTLTEKLIEANRRVFQIELLRRETQLAMLRSQINPHFLYNTLETVTGMALSGHSESIVPVTRALSSIFKYTIKGNDIVTFEEELDMVSAYLSIQKARFRERLEINIDVDEDVRHGMFPKMILQPLCENSLAHGLEKRRTGGSIQIVGNLDNEEITIVIRDNGVGMTEARLKEIQKLISDPSYSIDSGIDRPIGLENVKHRLHLIYGPQLGFTIESSLDQGTEIVISIPATVPSNNAYLTSKWYSNV